MKRFLHMLFLISSLAACRIYDVKASKDMGSLTEHQGEAM